MSISVENIPQMAIDDLLVRIGDKTIEKLFKHILTKEGDSREALHTYIRNILQDNFYSADNLVDPFEIKSSFHRKRQTTKKNWFKKLKTDVENNKPNPIEDELEFMANIIERNGIDKDVKSVLHFDEPDIYIENQLKKYEVWAKDKKSRLTDFPYLDKKQMYQIEKAFENDIVNIICEFLEENPKNNWLTVRPKEWVDNPVFSDDGKKMIKADGKEVIEIGPGKNNTQLYNDSKLSDNRFFRFFFDLGDGEEVKLDKVSPPDPIDNEILQYIMEEMDNLFLSEKKIIVDLRGLLIEVYGHSGQKQYDLIEKRLKKIGRYSFEGTTVGQDNKTHVSFIYNLFQYVEIKTDELTGRKYVEIQFSDKLHERIVTRKTIAIYSPFFKRLENSLSKILIYAFQKERIDAYVNERNLKSSYDYSFFTDRIRFRSKRLESNLEKIESSLQDFKNAGVLIEDYKRVGSSFNITLTPLSKSEVADLQKIEIIALEA
ncbi:hypothetical protein [Anaerobacillus arseniciselenatis]|uniref:hypothetical protein n=1 Tax=Anaerobacillus arseniciselenatis TaxID=85682 RepID=UPI001113A189|nr:hypothetical protein [Anaerobacillus arseniciselenatis]